MSSSVSNSKRGLFVTFEGTEGSGKSTQILRLSKRLIDLGYAVRTLREPGGTPIGEEIRHTLKHSPANASMSAEAELLLFNASRAQLVSEVIRPALQAGEIVICDRFHDSTVAYQGYGRQLPMSCVESVIALAVGEIRPDVTILLEVSVAVSETRRLARKDSEVPQRDRLEEADRTFFENVEEGFKLIANGEPDRVRTVNGVQSMEDVEQAVWQIVLPRLQGLSTG